MTSVRTGCKLARDVTIASCGAVAGNVASVETEAGIRGGMDRYGGEQSRSAGVPDSLSVVCGPVQGVLRIRQGRILHKGADQPRLNTWLRLIEA